MHKAHTIRYLPKSARRTTKPSERIIIAATPEEAVKKFVRLVKNVVVIS